MATRTRTLLVIFIIISFGCVPAQFLATPTPTSPPPTSTSTKTPRPTQTITPSPTPTLVFASYPLKYVWVKYTVESPPGLASQFGLTEEPRLVIYTDGLMIAAREGDSKIRTRVLNTREACNFINRLDDLGFDELEDSRSTEESNPLYDFGAKYQEIAEGQFASLSVYLPDAQTVSFFEPYRKFLARPMRRIVDFVETYNPGGLKTYEPDRLILFVQIGRDANVDKSVRTREWSLSAPALRDLANNPYVFLEGAQAAETHALLTKYGTSIYSEDNIEYTVTARLLYPHEIVNPESRPIVTPTEDRFPVNCKP